MIKIREGSFFWLRFRLVVAILGIMAVSLLALFSLSYQVEGFNNFWRQLLFIGIAWLIYLAIKKVNYNLWEVYAQFFYWLGIFLLVIVLFLGIQAKGTSGWLEFFSFHIQPVELMKLFLILFLANYLAQTKKSDKNWRHILITGAYTGLAFFLVILQPDLGSGLVLLGIWLVMLFVWRARWRQLLTIAVFGLIILAFGWFTLMKPYQKDRFLSFMDPAKDASGSGYHVIQSVVAIGSGGIWGKGLGHGSQSQLKFIPEADTDFIYAAIGEELGLVGVLVLMACFVMLFMAIYNIGKKSADNYGRLITSGVLSLFFIHFVVNVGMNLGMLPITGLPLPLVSYGGSALLVEMTAIGILINILEVARSRMFRMND